MVNAGALKQSLVCHYASLLMTHIERKSVVGHLSAVPKHRVCTDTEILKFVKVCCWRRERRCYLP